MQLTFNTINGDATTALRAMRNYRSGNFDLAIQDLQQILDVEPLNWDARLMLGACYFKCGQWSAAHRVFQFINDRTDSLEIRTKAVDGLQATNAKFNKRPLNSLPAEFGCYVEHTQVRPQSLPSWL